MSRRLATVLAAVVAVIPLAGCGADLGPLNVGDPQTQDRDVSGATAVELRTSGDLVVERGAETSLTITAGDAVIDDLTSEVVDGVLRLGSDRWGRLGEVHYRLVVPELASIAVHGSGDVESEASGDDLVIEVAGSGDVEVRDVDAESVVVRIDGSGEVELAGRSDLHQVTIAGSGDLTAPDLTTLTSAVSIEGSGSATVHVLERLDASIGGSGSVTHTGGAEVTSTVEGSGDVVEG